MMNFRKPFYILLLLITSCKCNEVKKVVCPENMTEDTNTKTCVCDKQSFWNGKECEYLGNSNFAPNTKLAKPISSTCTDWRDSLVLGYGEFDTFINSNGTLSYAMDASIVIRGNKTTSLGGSFNLDYNKVYRNFDKQGSDSLISLFVPVWQRNSALNNRITDWVNIYYTVNATRDTFRLKICKTNYTGLNPGPYYNLDSCNVVMARFR